MTAMATSTRIHPETNGARRMDHPATAAARAGRRVKMAAACYLGIVAMVLATVLAARVLPAGVGVPLFVLGMVLVVVAAHPIGRTLRSR